MCESSIHKSLNVSVNTGLTRARAQIHTPAHGTTQLHMRTLARSLAHWMVQLQGGFAKSLPANDAAIYSSGWSTPTQCRWPHRC